MSSAARITEAIHGAGGTAICAYLTAGHPTLTGFEEILPAVAEVADVVEVGVPFTDPMADGLTIQQASHQALLNGVTLDWIFEALAGVDLAAPHVLMGYYNPFLVFGLDRLVVRMRQAGTAGLIVPDLPLEESVELRTALDEAGLALIQLVAPTTPGERLSRLGEASRGFVYAVTTKGTTGGATTFDGPTLEYLDRVKAATDLPVLAGFGVRESGQVAQLAGHVDGVVVGSALIDAIDHGLDPAEFLVGLRPTEVGA